MGDSLGVVNTVDTETDNLIFQAHLFDQTFSFGSYFGALRLQRYPFEVDTDGELPNYRWIFFVIDQIIFVVDLGAQHPGSGLHEVVAVVPDVETKEVVAQQAV